MPESLREQRGRRVREVWVQWAAEQPDPKDSWLTPWEDLDEGQREVDMRIGEVLAVDERERVDRLRAEIRHMQVTLERKNRELDALHLVWCDGGCPSGVHRWSDLVVTEELVAAAERNARRLRGWYGSVKFRLGLASPTADKWLERYAAKAAAKTDLLDGEPS